jgi:undecaprenyl-phosphate 4-deoxy-4-formamido-L-arabinose transferase
VEQGNLGAGELAAARHTISVVIPVYQGELTLPGLIAEIVPLTTEFRTPLGHTAVVTEVLAVYDNGPDDSARVLHELSAAHDFVRPVWLSRNFGQHPATLAGMASSGGDWIVTLDEDGQHDPAQIGRLLDTALSERAAVVYAKPTNAAPHGFIRNLASRSAKRLLGGSAGQTASDYQSYRLMLGEIGRSVAAYAGSGVYLDVAMGWVAGRVATCPVELRAEGERPSGYSMRTLTSHFWRMVLSSGTKGLRLVSVLGVAAAVLGVVLAVFLLVARLAGAQDIPQGWPSLMVVILLATGAILFSLGVIAEYIGVAVNMAMGKPPYLIVSDPADGPFGRSLPARPAAGRANTETGQPTSSVAAGR